MFTPSANCRLLRRSGRIIFEDEALEDPWADIAPVIGLSTEYRWDRQTIRQADHSVADYALTGQNGPTDSLVPQGRSKRKLLLEGCQFSAVKRVRPDHSTLVGDVTPSPPVDLADPLCTLLSDRYDSVLADLESSDSRDCLKNDETELSGLRDENAHFRKSLSHLQRKYARSQQLLEEFKKSEIHMMRILSQEKEARERLEGTARDGQSELDKPRRGLQRDKGLQDKVKEDQRTIPALEKRLQDTEEKGLAYRTQISILKCTNRKHSAEIRRLHERMEEYHSNRELWHHAGIKSRQQREEAWEEERRRHQQKVTELRERLVQLENMNKILVAHNPMTVQGGQRHHNVQSQRGEGSTQAQVEQKMGNTHSQGQTAELLQQYETEKVKKEKREVKNETIAPAALLQLVVVPYSATMLAENDRTTNTAFDASCCNPHGEFLCLSNLGSIIRVASRVTASRIPRSQLSRRGNITAQPSGILCRDSSSSFFIEMSMSSNGPQSTEGEEMRVEIWFQYKGKRANSMQEIVKKHPKTPTTTLVSTEMKALHVSEAQKDLLALGLKKDTAMRASSCGIVWGSAILKLEWVTTKDSYCRRYLRGIAAHHKRAAKYVMERHLIAWIKYKENGLFVPDDVALQYPSSAITPIIDPGTECRWTSPAPSASSDALESLILSTLDGPDDPRARAHLKRKQPVEKPKLPVIKRLRPDRNTDFGDITPSSIIYTTDRTSTLLPTLFFNRRDHASADPTSLGSRYSQDRSSLPVSAAHTSNGTSTPPHTLLTDRKNSSTSFTPPHPISSSTTADAAKAKTVVAIRMKRAFSDGAVLPAKTENLDATTDFDSHLNDFLNDYRRQLSEYKIKYEQLQNEMEKMRDEKSRLEKSLIDAQEKHVKSECMTGESVLELVLERERKAQEWKEERARLQKCFRAQAEKDKETISALEDKLERTVKDNKIYVSKLDDVRSRLQASRDDYWREVETNTALQRKNDEVAGKAKAREAEIRQQVDRELQEERRRYQVEMEGKPAP
ncbi:hypothetical protein NM688_g177 [Phlebia brevispora]|uniref:Uncharacterized protein n=1 Tax=Phlebia brevispora TaxID=194682 RepID=A0ACC1TER5_9APHY|nr:hypothetical protein NM688_g177 [Phlebia brevispora]